MPIQYPATSIQAYRRQLFLKIMKRNAASTNRKSKIVNRKSRRTLRLRRAALADIQQQASSIQHRPHHD